MKMGRWSPLWILFAVMGLFILITARYYPQLPDTLATHFRADGHPDGWETKASFVRTFGFLILGMEILFSGLGALMERLPTALINLPNREYWLAGERRAASLAYLRNYMNWVGAATGALLIALAQGVYQANLADTVRLGNSVWILLVIYLVFLMVNTIGLMVHFGSPRDA